jgi:hypothetical protein
MEQNGNTYTYKTSTVLCTNPTPKETNFNNRKTNKYFNKAEKSEGEASSPKPKRHHHKHSSSTNSLYLFTTYSAGNNNNNNNNNNANNLTSTKKTSYKVPAKLVDEDIDFEEFEKELFVDKPVEKEFNLEVLDTDDNMNYFKLTRYASNTESMLNSVNFELLQQVVNNYELLISLAENKNKFLIDFNAVFSIIEKWFDLTSYSNIYNSEVRLNLN